MSDPSWRAAYPRVTFDKVRYADTDRQGHVNNAVFSTYLETGRVELLYDPEGPMSEEGIEFVIVTLKVHVEDEIHWPGRVEIGTRVAQVGDRRFLGGET